jgi:hypothetical protein
MSFIGLCEWLESTAIATVIRESGSWFPWVESIHVIGLTLVVGSIVILDLRLIGATSSRESLRRLTNELLPLTWVAFAVSAITGLLMFASNAVRYAGNTFFVLKMALLLLAGLNMLFFHFRTQRNAQHWDSDVTPPLAAKFAGAASITFWVGIVAFGRWIGFT